MPWYIHTDDEGNQTEVWSDEELEIEEEPEDDDEESEDDDDDDTESAEEEAPSKDTPAQFALVEEFYTKERAAIRRMTDASELRQKRQSYEAALRTPNPSRIGLVRVRDLLALVEQRELDLRAKRLAERKR